MIIFYLSLESKIKTLGFSAHGSESSAVQPISQRQECLHQSFLLSWHLLVPAFLFSALKLSKVLSKARHLFKNKLKSGFKKGVGTLRKMTLTCNQDH